MPIPVSAIEEGVAEGVDVTLWRAPSSNSDAESLTACARPASVVCTTSARKSPMSEVLFAVPATTGVPGEV